MPDGSPIEIALHQRLAEIGQPAWDVCACPEAAEARAIDPFTTYAFLDAVEASGSVGPGTGWTPHYIAARRDGDVFAVAPLYLKQHSQGEYVFDHAWAHGWERAGGAYYPKLQIAVPFTPATGRRFLTRPGAEAAGQAALTQGAVQVASENGLSSLHVTFCTAAEAAAGREMGLLYRANTQYHWENRGYGDFGDFLGTLASRKRKAIRKERDRAQGFGGTICGLTGDDIKPHHWDAFWHFYQDTGARKWGRPYLTRSFFDILHQTLRDDVLLVVAERGGVPVAGALNLIGRDALYGRYWGCTEDHPCLHFELCYYQAMDFAIASGLHWVEAGAQGEHKLARGYLPVTTHSLHWIADAQFRAAVAAYLAAERQAVDREIEVLTRLGPFRKSEEERE
jgi:predicted N-acyltransferase